MELRGKDGFPDQRNLRDLALLGFLTSLKVHMRLFIHRSSGPLWSYVPCLMVNSGMRKKVILVVLLLWLGKPQEWMDR